MYKVINFCTGIVIAMTMTTSALASESEWDLKKDRKDIKVYVKVTEESAHYSFKAKSIVKTNTNSLINLMRDVGAMDQWLETCREPVIVSEPDETSRVIHMKNDAPIFISDRDLVLLQRFHRVSDDVVMVDLDDRGNDLEEKDGYVRGQFNGHWKFTKISETEVEVEYQGLTDPKGSIPAAMANIAVLDVPYNTLIKIRKLLHNKETKYNSPIETNLL